LVTDSRVARVSRFKIPQVPDRALGDAAEARKWLDATIRYVGDLGPCDVVALHDWAIARGTLDPMLIKGKMLIETIAWDVFTSSTSEVYERLVARVSRYHHEQAEEAAGDNAFVAWIIGEMDTDGVRVEHE
jgi:hypothetical protein